MSDLLLTRDELVALTDYKTASAQIRWLTRNGIRHWITRTGRPAVPRSAIDGSTKQANDGGFQLGKVA